MERPDRLRELQLLAIVVPALCARIYETPRHSVLPGDLLFDLGTPIAVVIAIALTGASEPVGFCS